MKKLLALVMVLGIVSLAQGVAMGGLVGFAISEDGKSFGVKMDTLCAGATFEIVSAATVDYTGFSVKDAAAKPGTQFGPGYWGTAAINYTVAPKITAGRPGWFSFATQIPQEFGELPGAPFKMFDGLTVMVNGEAKALSLENQAGYIPVYLSLINGSYGTNVDTNPGITIEAANAQYDVIYAVPEPMTLSLLGMGAMALIRRRRA